MDVPSIGELENVLREAEEKAILARDEFASMIETKKIRWNRCKCYQTKRTTLRRTKRELEKSIYRKTSRTKRN